jgi:hypothetical protein
MAYNSVTFGTGNIYSIKKPAESLLYAFTPYYIEVTGTAANQEVVISVGGTAWFKRFTNASFKAKFPLFEILTAYFNGLEFGNILPETGGGYENSASKLFAKDKAFVVSIGSDTKTLTYDICFGAIQINEVEKTIENIYLFRDVDAGQSLPLTITEKVGDGRGRDLWVSSKVDDANNYDDIVLKTGSTIVKKYKIIFTAINKSSECFNPIYLRWVYGGEYRYFLFDNGIDVDDLKDGTSIKQTIWGRDVENTVFKAENRLKNKEARQTIECGVKSATIDIQEHLIGLQRSVMQWLYTDNGWIEVSIDMKPIPIDRFRGRKEVNLTIKLPQLYTESL